MVQAMGSSGLCAWTGAEGARQDRGSLGGRALVTKGTGAWGPAGEATQAGMSQSHQVIPGRAHASVQR